MDNAKLALDLCRKIADEGTVYLPTPGYLGSALGWDVETSKQVLNDLVAAGKLSESKPGFYRVASS